MHKSKIDELCEALCNGKTADIKPKSRVEKFLLSLICGEHCGIQPRSRIEAYLYALHEKGISNGENVRSLKKLLDISKSAESMFATNVDITDEELEGVLEYSDTSNVTNMKRMYHGCQYLTKLPILDMRKVTNIDSMCYNMYRLKNIPDSFDTSEVTTADQLFYNCQQLTNLTTINTEKAIMIGSMFARCLKLKELPVLNTENVKSFYHTFETCKELVEVTLTHTSNSESFSGMFINCEKLENIYGEFDFSKIVHYSRVDGMFNGCFNLVNVTFKENTLRFNMSFKDSSLLSDESIQSIINGLGDLTGSTAQTLTLHADVKAKLTEEQISTITSKNWNLA